MNDWIWFDSQANADFVLPCDQGGGEVWNCLHAGDCSGAIRFRHTSPTGVITDVGYPISMTIQS